MGEVIVKETKYFMVAGITKSLFIFTLFTAFAILIAARLWTSSNSLPAVDIPTVTSSPSSGDNGHPPTATSRHNSATTQKKPQFTLAEPTDTNTYSVGSYTAQHPRK